MIFSEEDIKTVRARYSGRFKKFGHSQAALGWGPKGKQEIRFEILTSQWDFENLSVLDIGAGFGDLFKFLRPRKIKSYQGIELVPELAGKGLELYGRDKKFRLSVGNFLDFKLAGKYDAVIISGLFNFKLARGNNYEFISQVLQKAFSLCRVGLACNFITDRVDYHEELIFNTNPEKMVGLALSLTKNFILRNDYFPFEFSLFLNKDDSFAVNDTQFTSFKNAR